MASANQLLLYKSAAGACTGGAIDATKQVIHASHNNILGMVSPADRIAGQDFYMCVYIKNISSETLKNVNWWLSADSSSPTTKWRWAKDAAGKNGTAQTIANIRTAPTSVVWHAQTGKFNPVSMATMAPNDTWPIWLHQQVNATAVTKENFTLADDGPTFSFEFQITTTGTGGTPDPGGGSGGGGGGGGGGVPPPTATDWKIAVAGDWGCGSTTKSVHDLAKQYDFIIGVGDNAYSSASCWTNQFGDVKSKMVTAFGNHEYEESGGIGPYKSFFGYSKTYFSLKFQNVGIVVADSNINMDPGSTQHDAITAALNAFDKDAGVDWIFAVMHHPWFGASSKHSYNNGSEVQAFHSLFMQHKVAFVFTGHNHDWQITKKVAYNAGSPTSPTVVDSSSPFVKGTDGLIHVVSGTGGHDSGGSLYSVGSQPSFQLYQNDSKNGIFEILASASGQTLTCSFVDVDGNKSSTIVYTAT